MRKDTGMARNNTKKIRPQLDENQKRILNLDKQIEEIESKLEAMKRDKEKKCEAAKEQLVEMIEITKNKYLTATGVAESIRVLRFVYGDKLGDELIDSAFDLAGQMAMTCGLMKTEAKELEPAKMDELCSQFYNDSFALDRTIDLLPFEMMRIDLCRNVGDACDDMVSFVERVNGEIEETEKALSDIKHAREQELASIEKNKQEA